MADYSWKNIIDVKTGDFVISMHGLPERVLQLETTTLTRGRRMMEVKRAGTDKPLRFSDDHEMWIRDTDGIERWGTYNWNWWLYEDEDLDEAGDYAACDPFAFENESIAMIYGRAYDWATIDGFESLVAEYPLEQDPDETIYSLILAKGGGYIVDGFVGNVQWCTKIDTDGFSWDGLDMTQEKAA